MDRPELIFKISIMILLSIYGWYRFRKGMKKKKEFDSLSKEEQIAVLNEKNETYDREFEDYARPMNSIWASVFVVLGVSICLVFLGFILWVFFTTI